MSYECVKPRFIIITALCSPWWSIAIRYQVLIVDNSNGETIASSKKFNERKDANELAHTLKDELQFAALWFK